MCMLSLLLEEDNFGALKSLRVLPKKMAVVLAAWCTSAPTQDHRRFVPLQGCNVVRNLQLCKCGISIVYFEIECAGQKQNGGARLGTPI
jgi:hypothetical protein